MDGGSGQGGRRSSEAAALGEEGAADGGFGLERCSLKDASAGEEGLTKGCSTERKAASGEEGLKQGRSTESKAAAGEEGLKKECSTGRKTAAGEEELTQGRSTERKAAVGEAAPAAREGMMRLSEMEVLRHLTHDPRSIAPYNMENLRGFAEKVRPNLPEEVLRMLVDSFNDTMRKQFTVFQNWVVGEFQEKGYVEVPDEFIKEREEAEKQQGEEIDLYLPERHFTTVVGDDGKEKIVFSFRKEEKVVSESKSNKDSIYISYSAGLDPEVKAACRKMSPGKEPEQDV